RVGFPSPTMLYLETCPASQGVTGPCGRRCRTEPGRVRRAGVQVAAPRVTEVCLLRALGLPAPLSAGLGRLAFDGLRQLDARFAGRGRARPGPFLPGASRAAHARAAGLVAAGAGRPSPIVRHPAAYLAAARRNLGLPLAGVMAWRLAH